MTKPDPSSCGSGAVQPVKRLKVFLSSCFGSSVGGLIFPIGIIDLGIGLGASAYAQSAQDQIVSLQLSGPEGSEPWTIDIRIFFLLTVLTLAPAVLTL